MTTSITLLLILIPDVLHLFNIYQIWKKIIIKNNDLCNRECGKNMVC